MIGKTLLISGIAYAILLGMGDYYESIVYLRIVVLLIFIGCLFGIVAKGVWRLLKGIRNKGNQSDIPVIFKNI